MVIMTQRLTDEDWLNYGLEVLAGSGFTALKAEPLAKSLGVSRGSFYWHFKDIKDYHRKLLALWQTQFTGDIITQVEAFDMPRRKLTALMTLAYQSQGGAETALRNWAQHNPDVKAVIADVDNARLAYVTQILEEAGLDADDAAIRAKFIYSAALGTSFLKSAEIEVLSTDNIKTLADIMTKKGA